MAIRASTFGQRIDRTTASERRRQVDVLPYVLLVPSIALIAVIILYPLATGLYYSLNEGSLLRLDGFVGLSNYRDLLSMWSGSDWRYC
jgi:ABC-type sugar transport system permease subunit